VNAAGLLAVQLLDAELDQIDGRRKRLPERAALAEATAAQQQLEAERSVQQARIDAAATAIEQAEDAGAELDRKTAKLQAQLKTVIAPREAEALMKEIEGLAAKHGELDDVELAAMDDQAQAEEALAALAARAPEVQAGLDAAAGALAAAEAELGAERDAVRVRRDEAWADLSAEEQSLYESAKRRHGGVGIARLERHTCSGCHVDLSQVEFERVMATPAGELAECPHCDRYLVH
jgi:predicted  nucleic acid-binding Zn-ribbon protein